MRVAIDIRRLSGSPTGIGVYSQQIVKALQGNCGVDLVCFVDLIDNDILNELQLQGIKIKSFGKKVRKSFGLTSYWKFIESELEELGCDVFWEPNFIVLRNLKKKMPNLKIVVTIHDLIPILNKEYVSKIYSFYFKFFLKRTLKYVDIVTTISEDSSTKLKYYLSEHGMKKITIIQPVIAIGDLSFSGVDEGYFLYIGSIEKRKGIDLLLKAYQKYMESGGLNALLIAGGSKDINLKKLISEFEEQQSYRFKYLGYITDKEKNKLLQRCSALILPSYAEGFGIPPMEALRYGKPIILSGIGVFEEIYGGVANFFEINSDDINEQSTCLAEVLHSYKMPNADLIESIIGKYSEMNMANKISLMINELEMDAQ